MNIAHDNMLYILNFYLFEKSNLYFAKIQLPFIKRGAWDSSKAIFNQLVTI